ncbi:hypothetical protein OHR68_35425 [Spirillospora sp. NBC_00431]
MDAIASALRKPLVVLLLGVLLTGIGLSFFATPKPTHGHAVCDGHVMNSGDRCLSVDTGSDTVVGSSGFDKMEKETYREQQADYWGRLAALAVGLAMLFVAARMFIGSEGEAEPDRAELMHTLAVAQERGDLMMIASTASALGRHYEELSDPYMAAGYTALKVVSYNEQGLNVDEDLNRLAEQRRIVGDDDFRQRLLEVLDPAGADSLIRFLDESRSA